MPDIGVASLPFQKQPDSQEAAVAAIFHELMASSVLKGYRTLSTGYKMSYDWWGTYTFSRGYSNVSQDKAVQEALYDCVAEFKYSGEDLVDDLEQNKLFSEIDLVVCWDFDESKLAKAAVIVTPLTPKRRFFHGTTHEFMWPAAHNLGAAGTKPVIALRHLLEHVKVNGVA